MKSLKPDSGKRFRRFGLVTIAAVYFLILVGGIVRSTGSGMGCPDWPKCFGKIVPPTSKEELPENYQEIYAEKRFEKNERLASILRMFNYNSLADKLTTDKAIYEEAEFNPLTTWIEYINRLVGVSIGLLIIGVVVFSVPYLSIDKPVFYLSVLALITVIFEGWLGSVVVSTNLLPFLVTVHMIGAIITVVLLIYVIARSQKDVLSHYTTRHRSSLIYLMWITAGVTLIQIILGTQVRQEVDILMSMDISRSSWVNSLSSIFQIHRTFSLLILAVHAVLLYLAWKNAHTNRLIYSTVLLLSALLFVEVVAGIVLNRFGFPAIVQPIHLLLGTLLFGVQSFIIINLYYSKEKTVVS